MNAATSPCAAELKLVAENCKLLDADRRMAWLASLRAEFKAKRNFVAGFPEG